MNDVVAKLKPIGMKERDRLLKLKEEEYRKQGLPFDGELYIWDYRYVFMTCPTPLVSSSLDSSPSSIPSSIPSIFRSLFYPHLSLLSSCLPLANPLPLSLLLPDIPTPLRLPTSSTSLSLSPPPPPPLPPPQILRPQIHRTHPRPRRRPCQRILSRCTRRPGRPPDIPGPTRRGI